MNKLDESLLCGIPAFSQLRRQQIREILDKATPRRFNSGEAVFEEGEPAGHFYLLLDGYIRVVRTTQGGNQIISLHIASGQLFGIAAALGRDTYPATAVTAAECMCLSWPMTHLTEFIQTYDGFSTATYGTVGDRLTELNNRVLEQATQQVEQRIANALLRLITQSGLKTDQGTEIAFPITRQDISEMTGSTLHTVSRLLSRWEKQGAIASRRKKIVVTNPDFLTTLTGKLSADGQL